MMTQATDTRIQATINALIEQRNAACNSAAELTGLLAEREQAKRSLEAELAEAKAGHETIRASFEPMLAERDELRVFYELTTGQPYVFKGDRVQEEGAADAE